MSNQVKILKINVVPVPNVEIFYKRKLVPEIHIYIDRLMWLNIAGPHDFSERLFLEKEKHWVVLRPLDSFKYV
jgi:hypothetical protein